MNYLFNLLIFAVHFCLAYSIFTIALVSNDIRTLLILLIIMIIIKYMYYWFGRCILTLLEDNGYYPTMVECVSSTLTQTNKLDDKTSEEIFINIGLLIILNKLLFLTFYMNYKNYKNYFNWINI